MLQQQRFGFGVSDGNVDIVDLGDKSFRLPAGKLDTKVARKTLFKIFRFAYIDNRPAGIIHTVDAGLAGDGL